jgi:hypothetical protein
MCSVSISPTLPSVNPTAAVAADADDAAEAWRAARQEKPGLGRSREWNHFGVGSCVSE